MGASCSVGGQKSIDIIKHTPMMKVNDVKSLIRMRRSINKSVVKKYLYSNGYIEGNTLTTGLKPFNVFARLGSGIMTNDVDQFELGSYSDTFMVCFNKPENDSNWNNYEFAAGSMAGFDNDRKPCHRFITTKSLDWETFNVLTINNKQFLMRLKRAAVLYTTNIGWRNAGYFFHCFPFNSVHSLHLHVLNLDFVGPHFITHMDKNLSLDHAIEACST
jgi:hypothetical protein